MPIRRQQTKHLMKPFISTASLAVILHSIPVSAVQLGNISMGQDYAKKVCAECHAVADNVTLSPNSSARAFEDIANDPKMTAIALKVWFQTSHPTMPDFILKREDLDNLIAYIHSLKETD